MSAIHVMLRQINMNLSFIFLFFEMFDIFSEDCMIQEFPDIQGSYG
jgi:hypothetical protein